MNPPRQKKLYLFDLNEIDPATRLLKKRLLVDLLNIEDPDDIGGPLVGIPDDTFNFPLQSVESVTAVDPGEGPRRASAQNRGHALAHQGARRGSVTGRAAGGAAGARPLLGHGL